jgi:class 3 adenylate cyclase
MQDRHDAETLRKVAALATVMQSRHQETFTTQEMESIGQEVGLDPAFMRTALAQVTRNEAPAPSPQVAVRPAKRPIAAAWWAAGWTIPFIGVALGSQLLGHAISAMLFFLGWGVYIGGGILLSGAQDEPEARPVRMRRAALVEMLFALQQELQGQEQYRAFLSIDVVGSSEMKRSAPPLAVEYSFGQFRRWVEEVVRGSGGDTQSAAGDGVMCVFPGEAPAVRAARQLQEGLAHFNAGRNRLPSPFQIRCGVSAGRVPVEEGVPLGHVHSAVIDRAAALQKRAGPGDIVVSGEVAPAALSELGALAALPEPVADAPAFSWRGERPAPLPPPGQPGHGSA